jgi:hypothetical protein
LEIGKVGEKASEKGDWGKSLWRGDLARDVEIKVIKLARE